MMDQATVPDTIHGLAVAPANGGGQLWLAACASGLYRTSDGGKSWDNAFASLCLQRSLTTASVAVSPDFSQDRTVFAGALGGILRSTDGGVSWLISELPDPPPYVHSLAFSPNYAEDGLVFAATLEDGIFRSWDRGSTWASWNFGLLDLNIFCLAISPAYATDDTLYVGAESGIFRSTNGGRAWREVAFPMDSSPVLSLAISPHFREKGRVYAGTEAHGVFRSDDGGDTWSAAGLQDDGVAVNQLYSVPVSGAERLIAVTDSRVLESEHPDGGWHDLLRKRDGNAGEISAATLYQSGGVPSLLVGMNDGSVRAFPISDSAR